jgi:hypothetical protein
MSYLTLAWRAIYIILAKVEFLEQLVRIGRSVGLSWDAAEPSDGELRTKMVWRGSI